MTPFVLVEETTTVAPRALRRKITRFGLPNADAHPSVGGVVESTHRVWRCRRCRALAVGEHVPTKCGKCGGS